MGGFITAAARQARSNIRPLLLPPASNPNASPTLLKRLYDLAGIILSAMILNYAASPFILLSAKDSILTWQRLGWYGHIVIMGSLVFFYAGGAKFFKGLQKAKGIVQPVRGKPSVVNGDAKTNGSTTGTSTPVSEKNFMLPPSVDKVVPPHA
jgi:lysophospholipid acyltransferase